MTTTFRPYAGSFKAEIECEKVTRLEKIQLFFDAISYGFEAGWTHFKDQVAYVGRTKTYNKTISAQAEAIKRDKIKKELAKIDELDQAICRELERSGGVFLTDIDANIIKLALLKQQPFQELRDYYEKWFTNRDVDVPSIGDMPEVRSDESLVKASSDFLSKKAIGVLG